MYTEQSEHSVTVNDGGIMHTSSFCNGLWNTRQALVLRQCLIRRNPMEVALYVRVSTSRQQQQQTIDQQVSRLRDYVATHSEWHVANEHIYRDDGYSGATLNRPGLDRLRDRAAMAAFDCILITAPDRLARNYVHQMLLVDELTQRGCRVEFVERPMSDDPHDQLLLQIRSAVAEYERTLIAERPAAALDPSPVWLPARSGPPPGCEPGAACPRPSRGRGPNVCLVYGPW